VINRRVFLGTITLLAAPRGGEAQRVPEVGVLVFGTARLNINVTAGIQPLRDALHSLGWIDGQNITLKVRFADLNEERLGVLARELVRQRVDVIVGVGTPSTTAAQRATTSIPIVFTASGDPVGAGFVRNLARPDRNITGTSLLFTEMAAKRLELLKEALPRLSRVAVLSSGTPVALLSVEELRAAASRLRVEVLPFVYRGLDGLPGQFAEMRTKHAEALVAIAAHVIDEARRPLAQLALRYSLPTIFTFREYVEAGGLMSYGPNLRAANSRAAYFIDRLLRGARPTDLPVEQVSTFELVVNLKTAKALGLTIPSSLLQRADQVIE